MDMESLVAITDTIDTYMYTYFLVFLLIGAGVDAICWRDDYDNPYAKELMIEWANSNLDIFEKDGYNWVVKNIHSLP